ncbi:MAG: hypothetical protein VB934_19710 [Polyangiaceae bacterium]
MDVDIAFAPGAEHNPLALWMKQLLDARLGGDPARRRTMRAMRAAVVLVAQDRRQSVTLRFDHGQLTIHDAIVGIPDVTFCADFTVITGLSELGTSRAGGASLKVWWRTVSDLVSSDLKVYGLFSHTRLVWRMLMLMGR